MTIEAAMIGAEPQLAERPRGGAEAKRRFKMAGMSTIGSSVFLATWVVSGKPDPTGSSYPGP